jgi:ankyrin repeat protein
MRNALNAFGTAAGQMSRSNVPSTGTNDGKQPLTPLWSGNTIDSVKRLARGASHWDLAGTFFGNPDRIQLTGKPTAYEKYAMRDLSKVDLDDALAMAASWKTEPLFNYLMTEKRNLLSKRGKNMALQMAAAHGNVQYMTQLLAEDDINPASDDNLALFLSVFFNQTEAFDKLINCPDKRIKITKQIYGEAIKPGHEWFLSKILEFNRNRISYPYRKVISHDPLLHAIARQNENEVKIFLSFGSRSKKELNAAFNEAVNTGNINIVKLLLPMVDFIVNDNYAIENAAIRGYLDIVELLLPQSTYIDHALFLAAHFGKVDVVKKLLEDKRVKIPPYTLALSPPEIQLILKNQNEDRFLPENYVFSIMK